MFFPVVTLIQPFYCRKAVQILTLVFFALFFTGCIEPVGKTSMSLSKLSFETGYNMKLKHKIFEHSIFYSDKIEAVYFSHFDSALIILCEKALYKLSKEKIERIMTSSGKKISGDVIMVEPTLIYQGEIQDFHMSRLSNKAVWLDGDDMVIFDISEENIVKEIARLSAEEDVVDAYLSPSGQKLLFIVELDREEDDLLFYNWYLCDIVTGDSEALFSEPLARPPVFLSWMENETRMLFSDAVDEVPFLMNVSGFSRQELKIPVLETGLQGLLTSFQHGYIAITTTDRLDRGRVSIISSELELLEELDIEGPDSDLRAVEWSPGTSRLLVSHRMSKENRYYLVQSNLKDVHRLMTLDSSTSLEFRHPTWLYDDLHIVWSAPRELHFFILPVR